jgi:hypothetical protein
VVVDIWPPRVKNIFVIAVIVDDQNEQQQDYDASRDGDNTTNRNAPWGTKKY